MLYEASLRAAPAPIRIMTELPVFAFDACRFIKDLVREKNRSRRKSVCMTLNFSPSWGGRLLLDGSKVRTLHIK